MSQADWLGSAYWAKTQSYMNASKSQHHFLATGEIRLQTHKPNHTDRLEVQTRGFAYESLTCIVIALEAI